MGDKSKEELISLIRKLEESETRYRNLVENSIQGMSIAQADPLKFIYVSPPMENITGYTPEEMVGFSEEQVYNLIYYKDREKFFKRMQQALEGNVKQSRREYRIINKEGNIRWVELFPSITYINNKPAVQGTFIDITDRKMAEIKIIESEKQYRELINLAPDAFFHGDKNGNFLAINNNSEKLTGYQKSELLGMNMAELYTEESLKTSPLRYDLLNRGNTITTERRLKRRNGEIIDVEMKSLKMPDGTFLSFIRDISGRKRFEEALRESEEKYKQAFKTSPDSININSMDGTYVDINDGFTNITGYSKEDVLGISSTDLDIWAIPGDREKLIKGLEETGRVENLETVFRVKGGKLLTGLMSATIIYLNRKPHILSITRDISQRKILEEELLLAKERAEESDRLKTEFLNNMSHEIRTPLNAIIGFANLISGEEINSEEKIKFKDIIEQSGAQLLAIISDIIDISKLESNQVKLRPGSYNLNEIMDNLFYTFSRTMKSGVELIVEKGLKDKYSNILIDKNRLVQVLSNLLVNAQKFTEKGSVIFGYKPEGEDTLKFYVKDTGIGIPVEHHRQIFDRFRQVDIAGKAPKSGTGLGLSIAEGLVRLFGGEIRLDSIEGRGSAFMFTIPRKPVTIEEPVLKRKVKSGKFSYDKLNILVAEDDESGFLYLKQLLEKSGCRVIRAKTGVEAVEISNNDISVNLALMDIKMPVMNGLEAAMQIKRIRKDIYIIAQTAYAMKEDRENAMLAGCDDYITKPIDISELFNAIDKSFEARDGRRENS